MKTIPTPVIVLFTLLIAVVGGLVVLEANRDEGEGLVPVQVPPVGGPFTLVDHTGKTVTDKDFRGSYLLIFFGYTFCPDVCPTNLSTVSDALDIIGEELAAKVTPIFVSVDTERDTPEVLADYIVNFHPRLVGLTGNREQILDVAKSYRVYFAKSGETKDDAEAYLIDHSAITYLVGPDGKFVRHFPHGISPEIMAERLRQVLGAAGV